MTYAEFRIEDTGIGIKKEVRHKLFKLFMMNSDPSATNLTGTGIGLTVSKKYVEALGGTMRIKSEENKGTIASFEIPI